MSHFLHKRPTRFSLPETYREAFVKNCFEQKLIMK